MESYRMKPNKSVWVIYIALMINKNNRNLFHWQCIILPDAYPSPLFFRHILSTYLCPLPFPRLIFQPEFCCDAQNRWKGDLTPVSTDILAKNGDRNQNIADHKINYQIWNWFLSNFGDICIHPETQLKHQFKLPKLNPKSFPNWKK